MFVQALAAYADEYLSEELEADAWEEKPVPVLIEVGPDGSFLQTTERLRQETRGKKTITLAQPLQIPRSPVNRNSGLHPLLAADDIKYVLGPGAWTAAKDVENAVARHAAFAELIARAAQETGDPGLESCARFYGRPDQVEAARVAMSGSKAGVLVALSCAGPLVMRRAVQGYWNQHYRTAFQERVETGGTGECLISGKVGPLAPTHEKIKGTSGLGGQAAGVSMMSFDKAAFRSYGWERCTNSPVSPDRAMAYVLALNDLLRQDKGRRRDIAGIGFVFWTRHKETFDPWLITEQASAEEVAALLRFDPSGVDLDPNIFYMAGLAGNGARLQVRYWVAEALGRVKANLKAWFAGLRMIDERSGEPTRPPGMWQLRFAIERKGEPKGSLALALLRRAIEGSAKPLGYDILNALLARLRHAPESKPAGPAYQMERFAAARVGLLRLCLNDIGKGETYMKESLDEGENNPAYLCGRLLAEYENLQETVYRSAGESKINVTVADRYYSLASTSPKVAFPKIELTAKAHFRKLRREDAGAMFAIERRVIELHERLGTQFPPMLGLDGQGRFALGYYHQKAERNRQIAENRDKKAAAKQETGITGASTMSAIQNRYDFVLLFDCQDGNPNGDPDSDNSPRMDPETFQGLVSDVCLKRKIRDYVLCENSQDGTVKPGYDVFVLAGNTLESRQKMPYAHFKDIEAKGKDTKPSDIEKARDWMCANFFDIRSFGAVMSTTNFNCGQVRGPVQLTFSRSINRVFTTEHTISRQAFTGEKDIKSGTGTFGRKHTIAYGLYRAHGFINPMFADKTGFTEEDLQMLWRALVNMFDLDRSAARGLMSTRGLYIFKHNSKLGAAPAQTLFESILVKCKEGVESPRSFADYEITIPDAGSLPAGIELTCGGTTPAS